MKCALCGVGELVDGPTTVTLQKNGRTVVREGVPALVCDNCGEEYLDEAVTERIEQYVAELTARGPKVMLQTYEQAA